MQKNKLEEYINYYAELEGYKQYISEKQEKLKGILLEEMSILDSDKLESKYLTIHRVDNSIEDRYTLEIKMK